MSVQIDLGSCGQAYFTMELVRVILISVTLKQMSNNIHGHARVTIAICCNLFR